MSSITASRTIHAPVNRIFDTIAHIENFRKAVPHIVEVEFLTEQKRGAGTKFRETRLMGKRKATCDLEVAEYVEDEKVRMVSDAGGTIWDTVFNLKPIGSENEKVELTMVMEARAYKFLAKLMNPLIKGMIGKAVEKDLDAVKAYCEEST